MKKFFRYFELSLAEQRGFILLGLVILCALSIPYIYNIFRQEEEIQYELVPLTNMENNSVKEGKEGKSERHAYNHTLPIRNFDPNNLSIEEWNKLGLSSKQAQVIKNYEAKGGKFLTKEDLAKMYTISKAQYDCLEPYIRIDKSRLTEKAPSVFPDSKWVKVEKETKEDRKKLVDIMNADSADWVALRGIGPVFARRILNYRKALGGFNKVEQVAEVYGIPPETFDEIKGQLYLPPGAVVKKLEVNRCTVEELAKHPYISKKQALWIFNYRAQHGPYKDLESLTGVEMLNQDFLRKIEPYLEF